jgi:periplasmic protein TonB
MFEQTFVESVRTGKTNKTWTVLVSFIGQIILIIVAVIIPMIYFDALPKSQLTSFLVAPPPPPPPPPPPSEAPPPKVVKVIPRQFDAGKLMQPKAVPKDIAVIKEEELPPPAASGFGVAGSIGGSLDAGGGLLGSVLGGGAAAPPPPPPQKKVEAATPQRIRVGGNVQQAKLVRQPKPVYPPLAKQARIQGVVKLNAIISKDGTIQNLSVISGHPLLVPSAMEAVKQWVYAPTLLNGEPVEVVTQIDVNFTLSQ